jgi:dTDP-4-amino-4,6-dideoxygalactose transaminase
MTPPTDHEKLAIDGGEPVIKKPLPKGVSGPSVIGDEEIRAVTDVMKNKQLFRHMPQSETQKMEKEAREYLGSSYSLMLNSGTSALICALIGVGIGPGDEVIVPGYTYISTAAAVVATGAVPVIAEIDDSLGLSPEDAESKITPYTKALIPVHMRGVPCKLAALLDVAKRNGLKLVEDCCQSVGGEYRGRKLGTWGHAGAWSLNYYKTISTGEGGLVYTDDKNVFERACLLSDPGLPMWKTDDHTLDWENEPFPRQTYRASEIVSAIARVQLSKIDEIIRHQRSLKATFLSGLDESSAYVHQYVDDEAGDIGVSASIILESKELAIGFAHALKAEGAEISSVHNEGIPDRHIYSHWDGILEKRSPHPSGYPWKDPAYLGNVDYTKDMCPNTLDILGRTLRFDFNMNMKTEHIRLIAQAVNKVDSILGN